MRTLLACLVLIASSLAPASTAIPYTPPKPGWTDPIAPFRIADNLYYVGSKDLASYLITTPAGDILINSSHTDSPPLIKSSIEQLGFKITDVKILLISHAHIDHDAGSAQILKWTHAKYMVMDGDVGVVNSGGRTDFAYPTELYPVAPISRILHDGSKVTLGGVTLTAHKPPGHTRGCTTWTYQTTLNGKPENVVIVGSWNVNPGYRIADQPGHKAYYPGIAADYRHTFAVLKSLPCDIFLGAHGNYFNMDAKLARMKAGEGEKVWIDPDGYKAAVAEKEQAFEKELKRQQSGQKPS
jgi:metallo-beta-lactamase class B